MNNRLTIQDLADMLAERTGKDRKNAELFLKEFITLITKGVYTDKIVKVKGLGTFKIILVERRESIHVNTGERFIIPEHYKFSFLPDKELKDLVNKPFSFFETTELNEDVEFSDLDESVQDSREADPEDESIEEVLPDQEAVGGHGIEEPIEIQGPIGRPGSIVIGKKPAQPVDRLAPPEELVGEIYRPGRPETTAPTVQPEVFSKETQAQETSTPLREPISASLQTEFTSIKDEKTEESSPLMHSATQTQSVQSESFTLCEDRMAEADRRESPIEPEEDSKPEPFESVSSASVGPTEHETVRPEELNPLQSKRVSASFYSESLSDTKEAKASEEMIEPEETIESEDENPYSDDYEFTGEPRRSSREGASFKKSVVLFFIVAILLIAGAYAYLNKDLVSGLIRGVTVPPIDTTEVSDAYLDSEEDAEEEIRDIAEAHSIELPAPYTETDSLSVAAGLSNADPVIAPASESVEPTGTPVPSTESSVQPSATASATAAKPSVSSGKPLAAVTIEPGSRLTLISLKYYGNKIFWVYLYEHNKSRIHDPNNVPIGTKIEVPAPELYGIDAHSRESIRRASVKQTEILTGE